MAAASELLVFLPVLTIGSGGGSPLSVADEFFDFFSRDLDGLVTFWGISSWSLDELSEESDVSDFDLKIYLKIK